MPDKAPNVPQPRCPRKPGDVLVLAATGLVAALALNAAAMLRSADKLPFDAPLRGVAIRALTPAADFSARLRLNQLRAPLEAAELRWLEPPLPAFPEPAPEDSDLDDDDLDDFLL